jgi:hypothetical protein
VEFVSVVDDDLVDTALRAVPVANVLTRKPALDIDLVTALMDLEP